MTTIPVKTKILCAMVSLLFMGLLIAFPVSSSWAAFSISATPYEGGYDLNFNTVSTKTGRVNKEMTVRVTSDIGKQYRVIQTLLDPMVNARGEKLPEGALFVYALRGSNKYGSLNIEEQVPVNWNRQIVYTSGSNGASDSFILVYGFVPVEGMSSGAYRGRIGLTLEPVNSSEGPINIVLNTLAEVEAEGVTIEIKTLRNTKEIQINSGKSDVNSSTVFFDIKNSLGRQFRVIQMVEQQPVSMEGDQLDWQAVECIGRDARKGTVLSDLTPLAPKQQVIYQSSPSGDADSFTIGYVFDPNAVQKAGHYKTVVKYLLDMVGADLKLLDTFGLNVENPRVFELIVKPVSGGIIRFTDVKATQSPKISEVQIEIKSNVGKQYQITQTVPSPLINKEGNTIPFKNFTLKEESIDTKGTLKFPAASEVVVGDTTLFVSDSKGSPDKFKIFYELAPSLEIKAGDYSTRIMYSISEL